MQPLAGLRTCFPTLPPWWNDAPCFSCGTGLGVLLLAMTIAAVICEVIALGGWLVRWKRGKLLSALWYRANAWLFFGGLVIYMMANWIAHSPSGNAVSH